jgi:hypothetical protein
MKYQHQYAKCNCGEWSCNICNGLAICTVCGGAEGSLTIDCCGRRITKEEENQIYYGGILDFRDGDWIRDWNYVRTERFERIITETKLVHCKHEPYDVLIDRSTKWGNPFKMGRDGDRMEVIRKHMNWLIEQDELLADLESLRGKTLGCWCVPRPCHGENYIYLLEGI